MIRIIFLYKLFILLLLGSVVGAETAEINIVYPKKDSRIGAADSSFIFGSITPGARLDINGFEIKIHQDGGFLAFLPLVPGAFEFKCRAMSNSDTATLIWPVKVPEPKKSISYDSLKIVDLLKSYGNLYLTNGDRLIVEFQATPGCVAYFSIPGLADSVPMMEIDPQVQPYWGKSVFGEGAVPDSLKLNGVYRGFIDIDHRILPDSVRLQYYLAVPKYSEILQWLIGLPAEKFDMAILNLLKYENKIVKDSSRIYVKINSYEFPRYVEFIDSVQTVRVGPQKGYYSIFQPRGVKAHAIGADGDWLKLKLSETQFGWVNKNSVKFLDKSYVPYECNVRSLRAQTIGETISIEIPLADKLPFRVVEENNKTIYLDIFGALSDTDWIRYNLKDKGIDLISWEQIEPSWYRLKIILDFPLWGYDAYYDRSVLKLYINKPPHSVGKLEYKTIVIDPGHSSDPGAIGPTGLTEAEANLNIALALRKELEKRGARVILTREDMSDLPLYDRPRIANEYQADLFISIHNNALPDGVNPFVNNGSSTYYYHPHSIDLARAVQKEMLKELKLPDHGVYYGNLAVNRPTQYPAILIECAFMMIPEQEAMLKSEKYQKKIAKAIRKGIARFLKEY